MQTISSLEEAAEVLGPAIITKTLDEAIITKAVEKESLSKEELKPLTKNDSFSTKI